MIFWATVLVFIVSIITFAMYPRSDRLQINAPLAEASVVSFVNQHQAAKDYMAQMMRISNDALRPGALILLPLKFKAFFPFGAFLDIYLQETGGGIPDSPALNPDTGLQSVGHYTSALACIDATDALTLNCPVAARSYIITYGYPDPDWWRENVSRQELWRKAILKRTFGSANCGTLLFRESNAEGSLYSIDTTQRLSGTTPEGNILIVPPQITNALATAGVGRDDLMFCISPFQEPYAKNGLALHIDAINNAGTGHDSDDETNWQNLINPAQTIAIQTSDWSSEIDLNSWNLTISGVISVPEDVNDTLVSLADATLNQQGALSLTFNADVLTLTASYGAQNIQAMLTPNEIFSFAYVLDSNSLALYINGTFGGRETLNQASITLSDAIDLSGVTPLNLKIYTRPLEAREITKNFSTDKKRFNIQ